MPDPGELLEIGGVEVGEERDLRGVQYHRVHIPKHPFYSEELIRRLTVIPRVLHVPPGGW